MTPRKFKKLLIAPSLLSADFSRLGEEVKDVEKGGADWLHVDVMDGHFVPNLTIGPLVVEALKPRTKLPMDCHLMVSRPEEWIDAFAKAGAHCITIHAEATPHLNRHLDTIRAYGILAGVSLNPGTSLAAVEEVLSMVDLVLVMSVNPGFGGQKFIESSLSKIDRLASIREENDLDFLIQVDGGVNAKNAGILKQAGADILVAGSAVFSAKNRAAAIKALRNATGQA